MRRRLSHPKNPADHMSYRPMLALLPLALVQVSLALSSAPALAQATLVADIETTLSPQEFLDDEWTQLPNELLIFRGNSNAEGEELWVSDGTVGGTALLFDIFPGPTSSYPSDFVTAGNEAYFSATSLEHGRELWRTDGTALGTELVEDRIPGTERGVGSELAATDTAVFYPCNTENLGTELCAFDGTSVRVLDVRFGSSSSFPEGITQASATEVCFAARGDGTGVEPHCSDGTVAGTDLLADIRPGSSSSDPEFFTRLDGGRVAFRARTSDGDELVRANLSTGAFTVYDINSGFNGSNPFGLTAVGADLFFGADTPAAGREPYWLASGSGSPVLLEIVPGSSSSLPNVDFSASIVFEAEVASGKVFFVRSSGELWVTEGSVPTTTAVQGAPAELESVKSLYVDVGDFLHFEAHEPGEADTLWRLKTTLTFPTTTLPNALEQFGPSSDARTIGSTASLAMVSATRPGDSRDSLFSVRYATSASTLLSPPVSTSSSSPRRLTSVPGGVAFSASTEASGSEPYIYTRGTGAFQLDDLASGSSTSFPVDFAATESGAVLFITSSSSVPDEPYLWNGSTVSRVDLLGAGDSNPQSPMVVFDGKFLLAAEDSSGEFVPWVIDPATPSTRELWVDPAASARVALGSEAVFEADGSLWVTDGSSSSPTLLANLPGFVRAMVATEDAATAFLVVGLEVWTTDGTSEGTGLGASLPHPLGDVFVGGPVVMLASGQRVALVLDVDDGLTEELAVSDGTVAGTYLVTDRLGEGFPEGGGVRLLGAVAGGWIYADQRPSSGEELWFSDGINPNVLLEVFPGVGSSEPEPVGRIGGDFYFYATEPVHGRELWRTDGTPEGTELVLDFHPGPASEVPTDAVVSEGTIFFSAFGPGENGRELWAWSPPLFSDGFETGDTGAWSSSTP